MRYSVSDQQNFFHLQSMGNIGVDIFFVISGFIIFYISRTSEGIAQGLSFLMKRFLRINPVYYISSFIFLAILITDVWIKKGLAYVSVDKVIDFLPDTFFIIPTRGQVGTYNPVSIVGWTLGFEWLFYFIFFPLIVLQVKNKFLWASIIIVSLSALGQLFYFHDSRYTFITNSIMLEFLLGVFICWAYCKYEIISTKLAFSLILIGIIIYGILFIYGYGDVWYYQNVLSNKSSIGRFAIWGIPSAFIVAGCVFLEKQLKLIKLWTNKLVSILGDASFSIYLIHPIIFLMLSKLYKRTGLFIDPDISILLQLFFSIIVSILFYKVVEKPLLIIGHKIAITESNPQLLTAEKSA
jgi:peptidoglycan/LPS O-acetylase OafA/YrhL